MHALQPYVPYQPGPSPPAFHPGYPPGVPVWPPMRPLIFGSMALPQNGLPMSPQGAWQALGSMPWPPAGPPGSFTPDPYYQPPPIPPRPRQAFAKVQWDVTEKDKTVSDRWFDTLDPWKTGYVDGEVAAPFFSKSKLPKSSLVQIWYVTSPIANFQEFVWLGG